MSRDSWNPQQYDKFKNERSQPFFDLMSLLQSVSQPMVVDLGCGTGELTAELHKFIKAQSTLGLDNSDEMLKKTETVREASLRFEKGDLSTWKRPQSFDIVFSNAAIQWCPDHAEILERIKESLKPGGQVAVQMPMNHDYPTHTLAAEMSEEDQWLKLLQGNSYRQHKRMMSADEYAILLHKLGFKEQKVYVNVYGHILESREGVIEWVKGTLLTFFKSRLSDADYQKFLGEFRERLFEKLPDEKPFFYPFKRIFIWGRL